MNTEKSIMQNFQGKKILFLTASFFGYEKAIVHQMKALGMEVDFFDERPSNNNLIKGIIRVFPKLIQNKTKNYYKEILEKSKAKKYDFFLLIKGEATPIFFLKEFKKQHPETKTIFYAYDSVAEYPKFLELNKYFDENYTFEAKDAEKYNIHFRPLFYINNYAEKKIETKKYDVCFIGSAHTDRYFVGEKIEKELNDLKLTSFFYYFAPSKIVFYLKRIFDIHFKKFDIKKIKFLSLNHAEVSKKYRESFAVLDINKPFQFGLSMRPFEVLVSERKLITTNPEIVHYPFYNPNNILILNRDNIQIPKEFFDTKFQPLTDELLDKISITSWLEALLIKDQNKYWKWWQQKNR